MNQHDLQKYQTENLFLLVGANPLPSLVAARLLAPRGARIWVLHSSDAKGSVNTKKQAERLIKQLEDESYQWQVERREISSSDNVEIENKVAEIVSSANLVGVRVGLNYTGGTKPMATHTYRTLERAFANVTVNPVFSYLDPNELALRIDRGRAQDEIKFEVLKDDALRELVLLEKIGESRTNGIDSLGKLHGLERAKSSSNFVTAEQEPAIGALVAAIAQLNTTSAGIGEWRRWIAHLANHASPNFFTSFNPSPFFLPILAQFENLCGDAAQLTPSRLATRLTNTSTSNLSSCVTWFQGTWLEEHVRVTLKQLESALHWSSIGVNYQFRDEGGGSGRYDAFELDVAALIGYQLFVFSCKARTDKSEIKLGFLEVFVRAQQLGGEEARAVLVTLLETPQNLENELKNIFNAEGKLKVFGREHLRDFPYELAKWHAQTGV